MVKHNAIKINNTLFIISVLFLSLLINQCSTAEVIVIGAGASGISAAKELISLGHSVTILEGSNKIGGRIRTNYDHFGYAVEEGAMFYPKLPMTAWIEKILKFGLTRLVHVDWKKAKYILPNGKEIQNGVDKFAEMDKKFKDFIRENKEKYLDKTIKFILFDYIRKNKLTISFIEKMLLINIVKDNNISWNRKLRDVEYFMLTFNNDQPLQDYLSPDGYIKVLEKYAEGLKIKLNTKITAIIQDEQKIHLRDQNNKTFIADYAIITSSLGFLKQNLIKFYPPLSEEKQDLIKNSAFFIMNKIYVEFEEKFWDDNFHIFAHLKYPFNPLGHALNLHRVNNQNLLVFFITETQYEDIKKMSDIEIIEAVISSLQPHYPSVSIKIKKLFRTDWENDPFAFGSFTEMDSDGSQRKLFEKPEGRLIFAGEHTSPDLNAHVPGAHLSGLRAANQINELVK